MFFKLWPFKYLQPITFYVDTLSFGYKRPETGDKGAPIFVALEDTITQLNTHDHDGVDSDRIDAFDLRRAVVSVTNSGWSSSGSLFKKTVTFPSGYTAGNGADYTNATTRFFFDGGSFDNNECFPKTRYLSATTFELYSPVNNQAFTVTFT